MTTSSAEHLLRGEWQRLFARRTTRVMMLLVLLVLALSAGAIGSRSHPHTPATLAHARAFVAEQRSRTSPSVWARLRPESACLDSISR